MWDVGDAQLDQKIPSMWTWRTASRNHYNNNEDLFLTVMSGEIQKLKRQDCKPMQSVTEKVITFNSQH